jgi:hypothetical protein
MRPEQLSYQSTMAVRPKSPDGAMHRSLKSIIERCWGTAADRRPTFDVILEILATNNHPFSPDVDVRVVESYVQEVPQYQTK